MAIEFLLNYEWKEIERLKDWTFGISNVPDMSTKVLIRRKETTGGALQNAGPFR